MSTTASNRRKTSGFTLLEVLVVLVIVSTMASALALATRNDPASGLRRLSQTIDRQFSTAQRYANLSSETVGVLVSDAGLAFVRFDGAERRWNPHRSLQPVAAPAGVRFQFQTAAVDAYPSAGDGPVPAVLFAPGGLRQSFSLTLSKGEQSEQVRRGDPE